jgi:Ca2+-binding RTX toxin-like protein
MPRIRSHTLAARTPGRLVSAFEALEGRQLFSGGHGSDHGAEAVRVVTGTPGNDVFRLVGDQLQVGGTTIDVAKVRSLTLYGGAGDDTYLLDRATGITIADSAGNDTVDFSAARGPVDVDLARTPADDQSGNGHGHGRRGKRGGGRDLEVDRGNGDAKGGNRGPVAFSGTIENLTGSDYDDRLAGNGADNTIDGGEGDDRLTGRGGADQFVLSRGQGTDTVTDFTDNVDKMKLAGGLAWGDLAVSRAGGDTVVSVDEPTLVGFASLPARTFGAGPTSGQFITGANASPPPSPTSPCRAFPPCVATATAPTGSCPTTATAPRTTRPTSCCGCT